ncbi:MAG: hypothetical protein FJX65_08140 [Alphaproteobacteria bacterium]|nr:hypothetical protein [Alphaproteobacteria bacterium]
MSPLVSRRSALLLGTATVLVACQGQPLPPPIPELSFNHMPVIRLAVGSIEYREEYEPPLKPPNVEHLFPTSPQSAARRWAEDRLRAAGGPGRAVFVIRRAPVVEAKLARSTGVRSLFTVDQAERYDAELDVALEIRDERGFQEAFATAQAERNRTVPENATLYQRERAFFEMTEGLMKDISAQLDANIQRYLAKYLR